MFTHKELYGLDGTMRYELPSSWLTELSLRAKQEGIEFMCTAFSPQGYDIVNHYVSTHKVASCEMAHIGILDKLRSFGKPVILSTAAQGRWDIGMALDRLGHNDLKNPGPDVTLMYCVGAYPARTIDFRHMDELKKAFGVNVGYSDHSTDVLCIPGLAHDHGATVLEKHFNPFEYTDTPDSGHSLNCNEFTKMVKHCRGELEFVWGSGEENEMRTTHIRRIVATIDIQPGDTLKLGHNFGIFRSLTRDTKGMSPFMATGCEGKRAVNQILAGQGIGPGDIQKGEGNGNQS